MTVIVAGTVDINPEQRLNALGAVTEMMGLIRSQKGCDHYIFCADPTSDTRMYVYEQWQSSEDLSAHLAGPYFSNLLGTLGKFDIINMAISKFKIALQEPIYDPAGQPRGDFFTE